MLKEKLLSIVVPCFNEEKNITQLYSELIPVVKSISTHYEIIFVDDGSRDSTFESIKKNAAEDTISAMLILER